MPDFFTLTNPANPYSMRLSNDSSTYYTHLIGRRAIILLIMPRRLQAKCIYCRHADTAMTLYPARLNFLAGDLI